MLLPIPLLLLALAQAYPAEAAHSNIFRRATDRFHKAALRHSAGLARDLRVAFGGLLVEKRSSSQLVARSTNGQQCVVSLQDVNDSGSSSASGTGSNATSGTGTSARVSGTSSATASRSTSTSTKSGSSASPSSTSAWKVAQSWVR